VCFFPSLVGRELSGAAASVFVVPLDLSFEELIGRGEVGDFLEGQESDQAFLEDEEAAFDFAFGLGVGSDAVMNSQSGEGALELGMSVQSVGRRTVAEEGEAIGVDAGWQAVLFEDGTQVTEMAPSSVAGDEGTTEDFSGVIVQGQNERRIRLGGPPVVWR